MNKVTAERAAQAVFQQRGYLVIAVLERLDIGRVVDWIDWGMDHTTQELRSHKLVVISETDEQDHEEQARMAGVTRWKNPIDKCRYYRVLAE